MRQLLAILLLLTTFAGLANALESDPILSTAERHVLLQTQGLPGKVSAKFSPFDTSRLPACDMHEAFTPPASKMSGKTHVGVRCLSPNAWSVMIPVQITVFGQYVNTTKTLAAGQIIQATDLSVQQGDLATLPAGIVTDPSSAIGKSLRLSIGPGQPIRTDHLVAGLVIRQNQNVRVVSRGAGFSATGEGRAINNASPGQPVNVRMQSGQTVSGIAKPDGTVEISF